MPPDKRASLGGKKQTLLVDQLGTVRQSQQTAKSAERAESSQKRVREALEDGEDIDGILRRRRLRSKATRKRYESLSNEFKTASGLSFNDESVAVDAALNTTLVLGYLGGESAVQTRDVYYRVRWDFALNDQ